MYGKEGSIIDELLLFTGCLCIAKAKAVFNFRIIR